MAREIYPRSDETFKVLSGHETAIAREMEKDVSYINRIKNGGEPDRYSQFRALFRAGACTTAPVEIWLNDLNAIYIRSRRVAPIELSACVLEKIDGDSALLKEIFDSIGDNHLDRAECHRILSKLAKISTTNRQIEEAILARLGELDDNSRFAPIYSVG